MRDLIVTAALLVLDGALLLHHRLWRDEIQAWAIAHESHSFGRLLDLLRSEGHPPLWYLVVWPFAHLSESPSSIQVLSLFCVGASALVVLRLAPWRWWIRVLLLVGYFPAFEYAAMVRGYTLAVPLAFGLCALGWSTRRRNWIAIGALGAVLGITSVYGFFVAVAILVGLLADEWIRQGKVPRLLEWRRPAAGLGIFAAVALGTYLSVWPRSDVTSLAAGRGFARTVGRAGVDLSRSVMPIPAIRRTFWESNLIAEEFRIGALLAVAALVVLVVLWALRNSVPALVTWVLGAGMIAGFAGVVGQGSMQFCGSIFLVLVAAFWAAASRAIPAGELRADVCAPRRNWLAPPHRLTTVFVGLLAIQTVALAVAVPQALTTPFSNLEPAATRLERLPATTFISVEPEPVGGALGTLMHRPVFQVESQALATYTVWGHERRCGTPGPQRRCIGPGTILARTRRAAGARQTVLVTNVPLPSMAGVQPIWSITGGVVPTEDLWAYRVAPLARGRAS